ncbi:MAG TPA: GTPase [Lacipirellulaceae bacterium]
MPYHPGDTICAIASAPGGGARGIIRVSGTDAVAIVSRCFRAGDGAALKNIQSACAVSGQVSTAWWRQGRSPRPPLTPPYQGGEFHVPCDAFVWPGSRSYTREPVVELHTLGSPPILEAILSAQCSAGARLAEAGEFTLRAFLAGRLDLTQAEAVLGVIDARGGGDLDAALRQLAGGVAAPLKKLRQDLLQLLAELEAGLDFAEEDLELASREEILLRMDEACQLLDEVAGQMVSRHALSGLPQVALVGAPNVGKSSLFNALVARCGAREGTGRPLATRAALVSLREGTTRDYLTARLSVDGVNFELTDTAGIVEPWQASGEDAPQSRSQELQLKRFAQALAAERRSSATIRAHCIVGSEYARAPQLAFQSFADTKRDANDIIVLTKCDLLKERLPLTVDREDATPVIPTSSITGKGLDELCALFRSLLANEQFAETGTTIAATAERCRESIRLAAAALHAACHTVQTEGGSELVAVEIRAALEELGQVVGAVYTDDLLDRIFSTFCIGK